MKEILEGSRTLVSFEKLQDNSFNEVALNAIKQIRVSSFINEALSTE